MLDLSEIQRIFNRSWQHTFGKKKLLMTAVILALCGVLVVFCRAIATYAGQWVAMSVTFLPVFLCAGILLSTGIMLIRIYHDEVKQKDVQMMEVFARSWEVVVGASYFAIPIILGYLLLWMVLGIFLLLRQIPGIGEFFAVILAFGPFLINLCILLLCLLSFVMLYLLTPILAFKGINRIKTVQLLIERTKRDVFSNIFLGAVAVLPLIFCLCLLSLSAFLTGSVCYACSEPWHHVLQWFFIMIPFTALLSPAVVFFFNFAAEAHVLIYKSAKKSSIV